MPLDRFLITTVHAIHQYLTSKLVRDKSLSLCATILYSFTLKQRSFATKILWTQYSYFNVTVTLTCDRVIFKVADRDHCLYDVKVSVEWCPVDLVVWITIIWRSETFFLCLLYICTKIGSVILKPRRTFYLFLDTYLYIMSECYIVRISNKTFYRKYLHAKRNWFDRSARTSPII